MNPNNFENNTTLTRVNDANCFAVGENTTIQKFQTIYVGPGQTVYGVTNSTSSVNPNNAFEFFFGGVQFTNGL